MTSRNSFSNVLKEDRKRRTWPLVLFVLLCFLMTAAFELNLESYIGRELAFQKIQQNIERLTASGMISVYLIYAGIAACLYGFQGFGWLTKKEQVDFYHSQPMKRGKRFNIIYINGIIMCLIPMMLHVAAYTFLIGIRGYLNMVVIQNILMNLVIFIIAFLMMYHLVILAVMLSGNMIVSFMLAGTIFIYPSIVKYLLETFFGEYFDTYAYGYSNTVSWIGYLSPVERVYRAGNFMIRGEMKEVGISIVILAVLAILFLAASFYLYKKRSSEAAGNALAYPVAGDLIRFLIVIPGGMLFGILFASLGVMSSVFWLYFGAVVGAILAHGFMEVIFHFDIKAALGKKGQLAASVILVLCIVNIFCFDIFGYDSYIPEENQVEAISYFINIGEYNANYHVMDEDGIPLYAVQTEEEINLSDTSYIYREQYQMESSETEDSVPVLNLIHAHMEHETQKGDECSLIQMIVHYKLKSGRDVYRDYLMCRDIVNEYYEPIYNTEKGKQVIYPYLNLTGEMAREVTIYTPFMNRKTLDLSPEEIMELAECYRNDIREQSLDDLLNTCYIAETEFVYDNMRNNNNTISVSIHIANTYKNMIAFFEERDIYLTIPNKNYTVTEAVVYNPYPTEETRNHPFWQGRSEVSLTEEQISDLLTVMIPDEYGYYGYDKEYLISGYLVVKHNATGVQRQMHGNIPVSQTPDYMKVEE